VFGNWRLVGEDELYNIKTDPSQTKNIADSHPQIVSKMKKHYENWWLELEPYTDELVPLVVGADQENPVILNSSNWLNDNVNTQWKIASGGGLKNGGISHIQVEQAGNYRIELNRWPFHLNTKLNSNGPEFSVGGKSINQGKALDIAYGCMSIGNEEVKIQKADQNSSYISFEIELEKGETQFRGWFMDINKNNICGAYYTKFTKL
jgi:arylsulfatase